jgi:hypothetical protein
MILFMNLPVEQYNNLINLNKTKTIALTTLTTNFGSKSVLLLLTCMQSINAIIKMVFEITCFLALLKNCKM